jgi:ribosomal-protein-alanine N-acetyltransferase
VTLRFRPMTEADLDRVMEISLSSFRCPWSRELFAKELSHEWSVVTLALAAPGDEVAGFMVSWIVHDELHVLNIATAPEHRRKGVGAALLGEAFARARDARCTLATLEVRRSNEGALLLYEAEGFRRVGIRPRYYQEEGEDAVVMVKDL